MSGFKSIRSLGSVFSRTPSMLKRHQLRRYSWLPDVIRVEGSIATKIIGPVFTVTIFAALVAVASEVYGYHMNLNNSVVPLLSVVVGLILVFRNSTSYDRYYEGRRDFGALTSTVRNLSRLMWLHINVPPQKSSDEPQSTFLGVGLPKPSPGSVRSFASQQQQKSPADLLREEKKRLLQLLVSFVYATMHHLRNEPGLDYEDYTGVFPKGFERDATVLGIDRNPTNTLYSSYATLDALHNRGQIPSSTSKPTGRARIALGHATVPDQTTPLITDEHTTVEFRPQAVETHLPLPLIIAHEITRQLYKWKRAGMIDPIGPAGFNGMNTAVSGMVDQLTNMERIATTPIPITYGIHLKQCVTLYLFSLPFTLVVEMKWKMIPIVTIVAFTLMGIEGIAGEIEMPFGKDTSDLPLDQFCAALKAEVDFVIEKLPEGIDEEKDPFTI